MKENKFDLNEKGSGDNYGIKIDLYDVKDVIDLLYHAVKNKGLPMSSHHGEIFNLFRLYDLKLTLSNYNKKLLFIFERKGWRTIFHNGKNYCSHSDKEATFTRNEKMAIKKMFKEKGIEIFSSWNDKNEGSSISIATKGNFKFYERLKNVNDKEYKIKIKEFIELCNDFGGLAK